MCVSKQHFLRCELTFIYSCVVCRYMRDKQELCFLPFLTSPFLLILYVNVYSSTYKSSILQTLTFSPLYLHPFLFVLHLDYICVLLPVCGTYPGRRRKDAAPPPMLFPCPSCQQDVELGEKGLADCLRNLTLERIVERCAYAQTP